MLRFVELVLFLSPLLLFAAWRVSLYAGWPSPHVVGAAFVFLLLVVGGLLWFQREGALPAGSTYVPAQLHDGRVIPGRGAPPS